MITYESISKEIDSCLQKEFLVRDPFIYSQMISVSEHLLHKSTLKLKRSKDWVASTALIYNFSNSSAKLGLLNGNDPKSTIKLHHPNLPNTNFKLNLNLSESSLIKAFHVGHTSRFISTHLILSNNKSISASIVTPKSNSIGLGLNYVYTLSSPASLKSSIWYQNKDLYLLLKDLVSRSNNSNSINFHLLGSFHWNSSSKLLWSFKKSQDNEQITLGYSSLLQNKHKVNLRFDQDSNISLSINYSLSPSFSFITGINHNIFDSSFTRFSLRLNLQEDNK